LRLALLVLTVPALFTELAVGITPSWS